MTNDPFLDESLISYVFRRAWSLRRFATLEMLIKGKEFAKSAGQRLGPILRYFTGRDETALQAWFDISESQASGLSLVAIGRQPIKVCAACMAENPYFRQQWALDATSLCLEHHLPLLYQCPSCGKRFTLGLQVIGQRCHNCATSWRDMAAAQRGVIENTDYYSAIERSYQCLIPFNRVPEPALYYGNFPIDLLCAPGKRNLANPADTLAELRGKPLIVDAKYRRDWLLQIREARAEFASLGIYAQFAPAIHYANLMDDQELLDALEGYAGLPCRLDSHQNRLDTPAERKTVTRAIAIKGGGDDLTDIHGLARALGTPSSWPNHLLQKGLISVVVPTARNSNALFDIQELLAQVESNLITTEREGISLRDAQYFYMMYGLSEKLLLEHILTGQIRVKLQPTRFGLLDGAELSLTSVVRQCKKYWVYHGNEQISVARAKQMVGISSSKFRSLAQDGHFMIQKGDYKDFVRLEEVRDFLRRYFSTKRYAQLRGRRRQGLTAILRKTLGDVRPGHIVPINHPRLPEIRRSIQSLPRR